MPQLHTTAFTFFYFPLPQLRSSPRKQRRKEYDKETDRSLFTEKSVNRGGQRSGSRPGWPDVDGKEVEAGRCIVRHVGNTGLPRSERACFSFLSQAFLLTWCWAQGGMHWGPAGSSFSILLLILRENRSDFFNEPLWDSPSPTAALPSPKLTFHPPSVALKTKHSRV